MARINALPVLGPGNKTLDKVAACGAWPFYPGICVKGEASSLILQLRGRSWLIYRFVSRARQNQHGRLRVGEIGDHGPF